MSAQSQALSARVMFLAQPLVTMKIPGNCVMEKAPYKGDRLHLPKNQRRTQHLLTPHHWG